MYGLTLTLWVLALSAVTSIRVQDQIWTITIGQEWGGHEYYDDAGYLQGFGIGLIDLVCTTGDLDCRIIWDKYENCFKHENPADRPTGGVGLMSNWYDACTGWVATVDRIHTFQFTIPYLKNTESYFYVLKGTNDGFDTTDMKDKKIAFLNGWANNAQCIARQSSITNRKLTAQQIVLYSYPKDVLAGLKAGQADAVFASEDTWTVEQRADLDSIETVYNCFLSGNGMMSRKDSAFTANWNTAFTKLRDGQKFNKFCDEQNKVHAHKGNINCVTF